MWYLCVRGMKETGGFWGLWCPVVFIKAGTHQPAQPVAAPAAADPTDPLLPSSI